MLPLGQRIQEKVERLIDKHMQSLGAYFTQGCLEKCLGLTGSEGASKVALSTLSLQEMWKKSGRLHHVASEVSLVDKTRVSL
jgi:prolyl-tRNA synthetase